MICLPINNFSPLGNFERADCQQFSGWAGNKNNPNQPINVQFYKDNPWPTGTIIGSVKAQNGRGIAVCQKLGGQNCDICETDSSQPQCQHGFIFNVPSSVKDGQNHEIYAYAYGGLADSYYRLPWGVPKTINCQSSTPSPGPIDLPDLNNDGQINSADLGKAIQIYGPNTQNNADTNSDGKVNGIDFSYFISSLTAN